MYFASQLKHVLEGTTYKGGLFVIPQREIFEKKNTNLFSPFERQEEGAQFH